MAQAQIFTYDIIRKHASKKGVTIYLDFYGDSEEAKMGSAYSFEKKEKILVINAQLLSKADRPLLLDLIRKVHESGDLIWKSDKKEALSFYQDYIEKNKHQSTLEFFKDILSRDDYSALKMAFFIRFQMELKRPVYTYKKDIRDRFGERGANIANLCTAEYFENEFIPFYNAYSQEEFSEYYELAVGKKARALFVHVGMDMEQIETEFNAMVEKALKYHMKDFRVHGLGVQNVKTIKEFFADKKHSESDKYFIQKVIEKVTPSLVIEYKITIKNI